MCIYIVYSTLNWCLSGWSSWKLVTMWGMCWLEVSELQTRLAEIQEEVCSPRAGFLQVAVRVQTCSMVNDASNLKVVLHFIISYFTGNVSNLGLQSLVMYVCLSWTLSEVEKSPDISWWLWTHFLTFAGWSQWLWPDFRGNWIHH